MKFKYKGKEFNIEGTSDDDSIFSVIKTNKSFYEAYLLEYIAQMVGGKDMHNSLTIDVGANIGNHSVFFQTFVSQHVISVEPNPETIPTLQKNLDQNISNFTLCKKGLGEKPGFGEVEMPTNSDGNIGMARLKKSESGIEITTLDTLVDEWTKNNQIDPIINVIKIDVEGMEMEVLKGSVNTIKNHHPALFIEAMSIDFLNTLNDFLNPMGYIPICSHAATPVYHFAYKPTIFTRLKSALIRLKVKVEGKLD